MRSILAYTVLAASTLMPSLVSGICCGFGWSCPDGTLGTPCCATGQCNLFCCACAGRCRDKVIWRDLSAVVTRAPEHYSLFASVNKASDGKLTLDEYLDWAVERDGKNTNLTIWEDYFRKFDKEDKGHITIDEIDA